MKKHDRFLRSSNIKRSAFKQPLSFIVFLVISILLLSSPFQLGAQSQKIASKAARVSLPPNLDELVARVMKTFEVPGLSLAIVKDGQVLLAEGYGVKKLGEPAPVDAQTLFGIASNSKLFTAVALGTLVDEGKIDWNGRVVDYLPEFMMYDPYVTREMTVKDLLCHRSGLGLGAGDLMFWPATNLTRQEILGRVRFIKPAYSFRSTYAYSNLMFVVAGELLEKVTGLPWEDYVQDKIQKRVGMMYSNTRCSLVAEASNVAWPHAPVEGQVRAIKPYLPDNINPAGGINSCAEDMAKWMLLLLNKGKLSDGSQLISEKVMNEITSMQTPIPISKPASELAAAVMNFNGYGLGVRLRDFRRHQVVTHTGGLAGYVSQVWLMPEIGLGITILTNQESGEAYQSLTYEIADYYLKAPAVDWVGAMAKVRERSRQRTEDEIKKAYEQRNKDSKPSLPLEKYAGLYRDAWYGEIEIKYENGRLLMNFKHSPDLSGPLEHWQYDTFVARWSDPELRADAYVTFSLNPDGSIAEARMKPFSPDTDFSYDFQDLLLKPVPVKK
ncbi:MAG TPA: serine hydrolase [Candidatus Saccharicenans sp.]|jgi:CubicO group peptidase (beta-lactamase class C family)|nr:serine hydrolase [Candidatus Saccharicenans sp.]HRD01600.1 serine hydrolase [Candidatus Saccharicenans sp.]